MSCYTYKVVPFAGKITSGQGADEVSKQLQALIDLMEKDDWEVCQFTSAHVEVKPCWCYKLLGVKFVYVHCDQVIFQKET